MRGISGLAVDLLTSQEGLLYVVSKYETQYKLHCTELKHVDPD